MRQPRRSFQLSHWLALSALVIVLDQASKAWIMSVFRLGESMTITPFLDLVLVFNPGAAFSFLSSAAGWQRWLFVTLALGISAWIIMMLKRHAHERLEPLALTLVLGGALGNVIDRLVHAAVVDFLSFHIGFHYWPAFNVADSAISAGVALLLWHQFADKRGHQNE